MKKSVLYLFGSLTFCLFVIGCSGGDGDSIEPPPNTENPPIAAKLVFPNNNSECTEGSIISDTESTIIFNWNDAIYTTSYELVIKNLNTQTTENFTSDISEKSVVVLRGTPYSWYVISKNATTEVAQSSTWKFYNAGIAATSYAPFPADLVRPSLNANLSATSTSAVLEWTAEDVDNDIKEYEVYFDVVSPPSTLVSTTNNLSLDVSVSSGNTYYWRIITRDNEGNTSESQLFQFSVD